MLRVPSSAHAICRRKDDGRGIGRSKDVQGADLLYAIVYHPPLCVNVAGIRAFRSLASLVDVVLCV